MIADILKRAAAIGWHPSILFREDSHALDGERLGCVVGVMTDPVSAKLMGATSRIYLHGAQGRPSQGARFAGGDRQAVNRLTKRTPEGSGECQQSRITEISRTPLGC